MPSTKSKKNREIEELDFDYPADSDEGIAKKSIAELQAEEIDKLAGNQLILDLNLKDPARQILAIAQNADLSETAKIQLIDKIIEKTALAQTFDKAATEERPDVPDFPTVAPALWAERTSGREVTPIDFIKKHYGAWVDNEIPPEFRLPRNLLGKLDSKLSSAYATWIGRHPKENLELPKAQADVGAELEALSIKTYEDLRNYDDKENLPRRDYQRFKTALSRRM
jgi:hypothetical protein